MTGTRETDYSRIESGVVEYGTGSDVHEVPYVDETPHAEIRDETYVLAKGWMAGTGSLEVPRSRIAQHGYRAVTPIYAHRNWTHPIKSNAEDFEAVVDALDLHKPRLAGHSMGSAVVVLAAPFIPDVESVTLVQPALMRKEESQALMIGRIVGEAWRTMQREAVSSMARYITDPLEIFTDGFKSVQKIQKLWETLQDSAAAYEGLGRMVVLIAEQQRLTGGGNMHGRIQEVGQLLRANYYYPKLYMIDGERDSLFPAADFIKDTAGLPFTAKATYTGPTSDHLCFTNDPGMADLMLRMHADENQADALAA